MIYCMDGIREMELKVINLYSIEKNKQSTDTIGEVSLGPG